MFGAVSTATSASWAELAGGAAQFSELVDGLSAATPYHWRARLRYEGASTPYQQFSRWITVPLNGWTETDHVSTDEILTRLTAEGAAAGVEAVKEGAAAAADAVQEGAAAAVDAVKEGAAAVAPPSSDAPSGSEPPPAAPQDAAPAGAQ